MNLAFVLPLISVTAPALLFAQVTASVSATVSDPNADPVPSARAVLSNPLTGYRQEMLTHANGTVSFTNLPLGSYALRIDKDGFRPQTQTVTLRSNVPVTLAVSLQLAERTERVDVSATESLALVEPEATGTRTELNANTFAHLPIQAATRGLEGVLVSLPGFAANANGAIHPRGAHNQMTYVIDGMPVSDQLTGSFANAVDPSIVQTVELFTGNVPAEFGSKVSGVAVVTTRTGMGTGRKFAGSTQASAAEFDTLSQITQVTGGTPRFGYFASVNTMESHRFLDQVSIDNLHNGGNSERGFARFDYQASGRDTLRGSLMSGRSSFELANLRSQQAAGQRQRQLLRDFSSSVGWLRTLSAVSTIETSASYRTAIAQLAPSAGDTPVTASQARHQTTITLGTRLSWLRGGHTVRGGVDYQRFPISEHFTFGITDPEFSPALAEFDLSSGGRLFDFARKAAGTLGSAFVQDNVRWRRFTFALGARYDRYRFLTGGNQFQPRVGVAFHLRETGTVFRASYNRNFQTPPNENLLLSSSEEAGELAPASVREHLGRSVIRIRPERQDVYEAGVQQGLGSKLSVSGAVYHKRSRDMQDNDNFFNTGIIFPTSLLGSRTNGAEARFTLLPVGRLSGSLSFTHYHTVVTPPFTGGLFLGSAAVELLSAGPFVIDHDQKLGVHGVWRYTLPRGFWVSGSTRYDSGLVSNPSDPNEVAADPDYADLLPYVNLEGNPPRVRPRVISHLSVGVERGGDRKRWELSFQVTNIANRTALYNFQSIFVGTRLVAPRAAGVRLRFFF